MVPLKSRKKPGKNSRNPWEDTVTFWRRAILLRYLFEPCLGLEEDEEEVKSAEDVLKRLLFAPELKHGVHSLE